MKKFTVDLASIPLYYPGAVKPVKRSYKGKTPKAAKAKTSTVKSAKPKKAPRTKAAKVSKVKATKTTRAPKAKKAPSRTREQIAAEAAAKRQARFDAFQERQAQKQIKEYEAYLSETEKYASEMQREIGRAEREYRRAVREFNKEERQKKLRQITENKMRSQGMEPSNYRENIIKMIADKASGLKYSSLDEKQIIADLIGINSASLSDPEDVRKISIGDALSKSGKTEDELTAIFRKTESLERKHTIRARGIEDTMDDETAKVIMADILASGKVSDETKEVLKLLGPKGALIYVNYRQIQFQKFGKNYKEQMYHEAAETFWDNSGDKVVLKKHGYSFGSRKRNQLENQRAGLSTDIDAEAYAKFAMTFMKPDEVDAFTNQLEQLDGFGKNLRVTTYTENGKTRRVVR